MYYQLNPQYSLRGWVRRTCVLLDVEQNHTISIPNKVFQVLLLCDGENPLDHDILTAEELAILAQCLEDNIVTESEEPHPIEAHQRYRYYQNYFVNEMFWSITGRCNFRCRHCYMDAPSGAMGELSTGEALNLIDQMADCGILHVDLTGGEPFVRKDFWQLVDRMRNYHMTIGQIYTNGWLLNDHVLDEFEKRSMKPEFSISFDGIGWHDWMRGVPGAEAQTLKALRLCRDRGFPTSVEMCLHKGNAHTLSETVDVLSKAGVNSIKVGPVSETELWQKNSDGNVMTEQEYNETALAYIPEFFKAGCHMKVLLSNVVELNPEKIIQADPEIPRYKVVPNRYDGTESCLGCHLCETIRSACYISPEGRLLPCLPITSAPQEDQDKFPLIREIGLQKGLSDSFFMDFIDKRVRDLFAENEECNSCEYRFKCGGGCRASALLEGDHNLMGCDRSQCLLFKEGYPEKIRKAAEEAIAKYCKD